MVVVRGGTTGACAFRVRALPSLAMRRPQPARGLLAVMSSLLVAIRLALPASAAIAPAEPRGRAVLRRPSQACTKWRSRCLRPRPSGSCARPRPSPQTRSGAPSRRSTSTSTWPRSWPRSGPSATPSRRSRPVPSQPSSSPGTHIKYPRGGTRKVDVQAVLRRRRFHHRPVVSAGDVRSRDAATGRLRAPRSRPPWTRPGASRCASTAPARPAAASSSRAIGRAPARLPVAQTPAGFKLFHNSTRRAVPSGSSTERSCADI